MWRAPDRRENALLLAAARRLFRDSNALPLGPHPLSCLLRTGH